MPAEAAGTTAVVDGDASGVSTASGDWEVDGEKDEPFSSVITQAINGSQDGFKCTLPMAGRLAEPALRGNGKAITAIQFGT